MGLQSARFTLAINPQIDSMKLLSTLLLTLMSTSLTACGILLWKRRKEVRDHSRTIQAVLSGVSAYVALILIFRTWAETLVVDESYLEPEHIFMPIFLQLAFFLYPLEVVKPTGNHTQVYAFLYVPLLLLAQTGICGGITFTAIHTYHDLWLHLGEANVWLRLLTLAVMLYYCLAFYRVHIDCCKCKADYLFFRNYTVGLCLMGLLYLAVHVTHSHVWMLLLLMAWMAFFFSITYYELKIRKIK